MPLSNRPPARIGLVRGILLLVFVCGASPLAAQEELQLQRSYPGSGPFTCPPPLPLVEPSPQQRGQASQLVTEADNAVILGDYARAEQLFAQASELDPTSSDASYGHARALETLGRPQDAMVEYCRVVALGADAVELQDAQSRLRALDEELRARISPEARGAFALGVTQADAGFYDQSLVAFTDALGEVPDWPEALYNRAVVLERMGLTDQSLQDYRTYLALRPDAVDPRVAAVAQRIGMLEGLGAAPTPSPSNTLAFGVLFPGMGQYYSGRNRTGTIVLGSVIGAVASGFLYRKVTVRCLNASAGANECAPEDVVDESTSRPLLAPALGLAAAATIGGAVEAWIRARHRREEQESRAAAPDEAFGFAGPSIRANGDRLDLSVVSLRFR
jgi:tetratricopeptide (TPR) repeat protein